MTLTALSVNRNGTQKTRLVGRHNNWFVPGLYKNELKRTWTLGFLFAIILFFAIPVANLLRFSNSSAYYEELPQRVTTALSQFFSNTNLFITVYACLGGLMSAMIVAEYLFDKRKIHFACSLPVSRQAYLLSKSAANLTWAVLAWIPAGIIMMLVTMLTPMLRPNLFLVLGGFFEMFGAWLCLHLYFFGLTLLACCFCGTGIMGACMVLMLGGYIPIAALTLIGYAEIRFPNFWSDWYLSYNLFSAISGVFRIIFHAMLEKSVWFMLGCALLGILFITCAVILTVIRKSEAAGTPFAFTHVRDLVKYLIVILAALLGGMLFEVMSDSIWSFFWMLFGIICGAALSWMLCNTVFYKTPKMIFEGKRGICILTASVLLVSVLANFDILHFNSYVPSNTMTAKIQLNINNNNVELDDPSLIRTYNAMTKNGYKTYDKYGDMALYNSRDIAYNTDIPGLVRWRSVWYTRYLFPVAKYSYTLPEDWAVFVQALTAKEDFADLYLADVFEQLADLEQKNDTVYTRYSSYTSLPESNTDFDIGQWLTGAQLRTILETYRNEMRALGADAMQQQYIGSLNIDGTINLPVFASYEQTKNLILDTLGRSYLTYEKTECAYTFLSAKVYCRGTCIDTLSESEWNALYAGGSVAYNSDVYTNSSPLTLLDGDYGVEVSYNVKETTTYYYETVEEKYDEGIDPETGEYYSTESPAVPTDSEVYENEYTQNIFCGFFYGQVPETFLTH